MNASHGEPPHFQPSMPPGASGPPTRGDVPARPPGPPVAQGDGGGRYPADQAFAAGGGLPWAHISKRYTWQRRITAVLWAVPIGGLGGFLMWSGGGALGAILWIVAVVLAAALWWIVAELAYRSYGYAERPDDFIVTSGVFIKRLVVVPYGRMQFVDVTAGLLERWMGIATVQMHTAAAATDAEIPGLPAAEAALLRDRLAQKGEERSMGL